MQQRARKKAENRGGGRPAHGPRRFFPVLICAAAAACASFPDPPRKIRAPAIEDGRLVSFDGARLGLDVWPAQGAPRAVIVAVHGMNDYANAFSMAGRWWAREAAITTYAYDQRGFGRSPDKGLWPGSQTLRQDLLAAVEAVEKKHPDTPVFVVGHSMGAGVALSAMAEGPLPAAGVILAAPGVWGGSQLPLAYRVAANIAATFAPAKTVTGERADRRSTDNIEVLRAMATDPHVIKDTRLDAVLGVTRLMGEAYDAADEAGGAILFLFGMRDEIIPLDAMTKTVLRLGRAAETHGYADGWHLLFRDLQAEEVWRDVAEWIEERVAAGPDDQSGPAAQARRREGSSATAAAASNASPERERRH